MNHQTKTIITIIVTAAITFGLSIIFINSESKSLKLSFVEMQAFNDINRVENYDTLEQLLEGGCHKEALKFVKIQQQSLLSGINDYFVWRDTVKEIVKSRSNEVYVRSVKSSRPTQYTKPMC